MREYKIRQDWVGKMIHWELHKKFKFDHMTKWYMHKPESVLKNETQKILCDHQISVRRPDLVIVNKKKEKKATRLNCGFCRSG